MSLHKTYLEDGEAIWKIYWVDLGGGSLKDMAVNFPINPRTQKPITKDAGYKRMWRWACRPENFHRAFELFQQHMVSIGEAWTETDFRKEVLEKAQWAVTPKQYRKWYAGTAN